MNIHAPILKALEEYKKAPMTGFHIPGHNRGEGILENFSNLVGRDVLSIDTTDEFDNLGTLHPATGAIKEAMELAANAFGAKRTFFLTGGSTIGNLALAFGTTKKSDEILIGRNCHRSVLAGMIITGANPNWIIPKKLEDWSIFGAVEAEQVEIQLQKNPKTSLVWITNPTYEGVLSDIEEIAKICHKHNVPLVVDEAHGCLWNFSDRLPTSALHLGADAVVHSLHKTGGSMVQSSMLHISHNSRFDIERLEHSLMLLHSTSPSLLLLASLDCARANLDSEKGKAQIESAIDNAIYLRENLTKIKNISVLEGGDITKIFLKVDGITGIKLEKILEEEFKIEIESASDEGLLVLSNIGGKKEEFKYLISALKSIANRGYSKQVEDSLVKYMPLVDPKIIMSPRSAYFVSKEMVKKEESIGRICSEIIAFCPPGISILLPGEVIREEHMPYLRSYSEIEVVKN